MDLSPDEDNFQGRLLHQAALWDNVELLEELLCGGADPDTADEHGRTALHAAALAERSRCLVALARAGTRLDARSDTHTGGKTALHVAAELGHAENVRALLAAGASVDERDANNRTPLALAEARAHRHAAHELRQARDADYEDADAAFEVTHYFVDDVEDPAREKDALERSRLESHAALRALVSAGECARLAAELNALGAQAGLVANLTPGGANTLLYVASEAGLAGAVRALVAAGADGRAHPVTKYGPLYIAAYHGHRQVASLLLQHFPDAVQQETVEKWLPLHAACIGGHAAMVTLLLDYPYPQHVLNTYTDARGSQYLAAFDVNARDVSGQTALYIACTLGNLAVVDALLAHTAPAATLPAPLPHPAAQPAAPPPRPAASPARSGISLGIHAIVSKLTGHSQKSTAESESVSRVRPVRTDVPRGADSVVACAARHNHTAVLARLLAAGADPNASAAPLAQTVETSRDTRRRSRSACDRASPSPASSNTSNEPGSGATTALAVACWLRHVQAAELLLAHGAGDPAGGAAQAAAHAQLPHLLARILATKAYPDPEHKLNKSAIATQVFASKQDSNLTYSSLCPTQPVMVNWRELRTNIPAIRMCWLSMACSAVNRALSSEAAALAALTRLDVAGNELRTLPAHLFTLVSIRYINAAQNKLERLPSVGDPPETEEGPGGDRNRPPAAAPYSAPALQELYLQDNRLEELPPALFCLPALATLDVSNNKLRELPERMWRAPALRDLNAALNLLRSLPATLNESVECGSPTVPSAGEGSPAGRSFHKPSSRSPSSERSEGAMSPDDEDATPAVGHRAGNAVCAEARRAHTWRGVVEPAAPPAPRGASPLQTLNLAHNQFTCIPPPLACRAPSLTRLNMAYNSLRSMSYVTSYPTSLRQLDLSHNEITCWPSLPQVEHFGSSEGSPLACYCPGGASAAVPRRPRSGGSVRTQLLNAACPARRHLRLEGLRTLILANNLLTRIQLTTDDDGSDAAPHAASGDDDDDDWGVGGGSPLKGRLLFPLLSMLDVSSNLLRALPAPLHHLTNLAVLNISGNKDITELPPQMGLLSRLWSLNAAGCSLQEPLRSMVAGGKYKSTDIVGYLKSVLHAATKYTRMKLMFVGEQGIGKTSLLECLRQESAIQHRRKPTEHWAKRMGNKSSRRNMSTVGVDIGTWVYEKPRSARPPVTFRTWDFGGQHEYYATHQYFLSRRSLYVVVWRAPAGRRGLAAALGWLRSVQARAPGAPALLVATHHDQLPQSNLPESESWEALQRLIRTSIMGAPDADKLGLPRVLDSIEVSCSTRHNIRLLADIIYTVAYTVRPPGSKEPLLEQRIPASYLALEECVTSLANELPEPVLTHNEYRRLVSQWMQSKGLKQFRDGAELHQATMFLHENGVLLHYDDATLKELYFLRPQWLCDVLAHVVTVREVNPFATQGIMKVEDLAHVFKASPALARGEEASQLGLSLLNKFELALCWDARVLLVPALLPPHEPAAPQLSVRARHVSGTPRRAWPHAAPHLAPLPAPLPDHRASDSPTLLSEWGGGTLVEGRAGSPLRRLLLLTYVPCGFWARLCTRLLADNELARAPQHLYSAAHELECEDSISRALDLNWGWKLWQRGLRLVAGALTLLVLREVPPKYDPLVGAGAGDTEREGGISKLRVCQDGSWCELDVQSTACIEIMLPAQVAVARRDDGLPLAGYQSITVEPNPEVLARVLALVSDHVDLLLEDWYPSLGTRFVHTSEGRCLITRVVPCPACLRDLEDRREQHDLMQAAFRRLELGGQAAGGGAGGGAGGAELPRPRVSQDSRASDGDSGVGAESNASSRLGSVEGVCDAGGDGGAGGGAAPAHAWTVEQCILAGCGGTALHCPHHGALNPGQVAPDTLLLDVEEGKRARWEHITRTSIAGRGAFGTVVAGVWRPRGGAGGGEGVRVAVKALQPVPPPPGSDIQAQHAYKAALARWEREPAAAACRAYCGLRQELCILSRVRHAHVVPLLAVCCAPLALLLPLAPQGSLDAVVRGYRSSGSRVSARCARAVLLQVARALEHLHTARIVYRDLKCENVLVWRMPQPHAEEPPQAPLDVHVKLADYGISRLAPPAGTKGFGGTEGFMAPEIMRYNGEEEYNEKVDCFSFGMVVYEVLTGRQPFEGHEAVKEAILEGGRPSLSPRDLEYPVNMLETMRRCWAGLAAARPSAGALVSLHCAPEYCALRDAAGARPASAATAVPILLPEGAGWGWEVWYGGGEPERVHALLTTETQFTQHYTVRTPPDKSEPVLVTSLCRVANRVWVGDSAGRLAVYSASTCALLWTVKIQEVVGGASCGIAALQPLENIERVALALTCGRLFVVRSSRPRGESSFVLTELGTATELCCLAALTAPDHGYCVWAGGESLSAYCVSAVGARSADSVPAPEGRVAALATLGDTHVFGYMAAGVCVYQWCAMSKQQTARLDCSKLAPCSESLQSITVEDGRQPARAQVTALCAVGRWVIAGTAWGCLIVADAPSLRPLTVCRPYEADVSVLLPLPPRDDKADGPPLLASFGTGYRPLLQRYAPSQSANSTQFTGSYCLLWTAQHWLPD